jgi:rhamnulokinase
LILVPKAARHLGRLRAGVLDLSEVHRFANEPHRAGGALEWNADRLGRDIRHALDITSSASLDVVGVDAWGVDYALLGDDGGLLEVLTTTSAPPRTSGTRSAR